MATNFTELNFDSIDIAKAIRYSAKQHNLSVNMTQIQKLMYIIYGTILVIHKERLTTEHPSAWPYGPVFPRVHKKIKLSDDITEEAYNEIKNRCSFITSIIYQVVQIFGKLSAGQLSELSHQKDSPWDIAVQNSGGKWNTKLDDEDIFNYFFSFVKLNDDEQ